MDQNDLSQVAACAEAMEIGHYTLLTGVYLSDRGIYSFNPEYNPIIHDDQAMDLMKKFLMKADFLTNTVSIQTEQSGESFESTSTQSLNHAVVLCVATMQASKEAAVLSEESSA